MLIIPIVAFGAHHVAMAHFLIASLRSAGNLPDVESRVQIYTDAPSAFKRCGYEIIHLTRDELNRRGEQRAFKHAITSSCYQQAMREGYPIVPVSADMICPTGMLVFLERLSKKWRVVLVPVLRTDSALMGPALPIIDGAINLSPRELCRLAFDKLHPLQCKLYLDKLPADIAPTSIFRRVGNTISARCFHMHPILLRLDHNVRLSPGIDGELMARMTPKDCYVVTDSDETVVFDLTDINYNWSAGYEERFSRTTGVAEWAYCKANKMHRWFFTHECLIHSGDAETIPPDARLESISAAVAALP